MSLDGLRSSLDFIDLNGREEGFLLSRVLIAGLRVLGPLY